MLSKFSDILDRVESIIEKMCVLVEKMAPIAQMVAPFTGPSAPAVLGAATAAGVIATVVDKAIDDHQADSQSPVSAISALASIAHAVADNVDMPKETADKIKAITGALSPEVMAMLKAS